jgi:hypothetical protein
LPRAIVRWRAQAEPTTLLAKRSRPFEGKESMPSGTYSAIERRGALGLSAEVAGPDRRELALGAALPGGVFRLRPFTEADVPAVVGLVFTVFTDNAWSSPNECAAYVRDVFFANPWRDDDLPSWVAEDGSGVSAFCGIVPRRMAFRGREIRVAVSTAFMVHPRARSNLTAIALAKKILGGAQDLTLTDGATPDSCRLWRRVGGAVPPLYNLHWIHALRPARCAATLLAPHSRAVRSVSFGLRPLLDLADALWTPAKRGGAAHEALDLLDRPLSAADVAEHAAAAAAGYELVPLYDEGSVGWLLERLAKDPRNGALRAQAVLCRKKLVGWYIYHAAADGIGEVVQIAARETTHELIWRRLLEDASRQRVVALRGRLQPETMDSMARRRSWLRMEGPHLLVHSRHREITDAIQRGAAFLSRFDGEWWIRVATG